MAHVPHDADTPPAGPPAKDGDLVGKTVAHFLITGRVGEGGMGVVYRARDTKLRREVALKVLLPEIASDEERRGMFLREARSAAAVTHPNIAAVYEVDEDGDLVFIAMELVKGTSLAKLIEAGLSIPRAIEIARDIARGLGRAHHAGVIHRDLKPDNVMIADDGLVKILDFGLAKRKANKGMSAATAAFMVTAGPKSIEGVVYGTPAYMSPEQAYGKNVDHRSDVFAFGVVLYQMVTGKKPFDGETRMDILVAVTTQEPRAPSKLRPQITPALDRIILRCLAKSPEHRYPDCDAVVADLDEHLRLLTVAEANAGASEITIPSSQARKPSGRRWLVAAAALAALLVAVGVVGRRATRGAPSALRPTAVTELAPPTTTNPEALAAYNAGTRAMRDGNWSTARASFQRAIKLDPTLGLAHLRLALTSLFREQPSEVHELFSRALDLRGTLTQRDLVFLDGLAPVLQRDPPDRALAAKRFAEAVMRYPYDAEFYYLRGLFLEHVDWEESLKAVHNAIEIDPKYADAIQAEGDDLAGLGRNKEAMATFQRCIDTVESTVDCLSHQIYLHEWEGECGEAEKGSRQWIARHPSDEAYLRLANALYSLGRPADAVDAALQKSWDAMPVEERERARRQNQSSLFVLRGAFEFAISLQKESLRADAANPNGEVHAAPSSELVEIYLETGRDKLAAEVAEDYLNHKDVWVSGSLRGPSSDPTPRMLHAMRRGGKLTREAYDEERKAWIDSWLPRASAETKGDLWLRAYAANAFSSEDAREALDELPKYLPLPVGGGAGMLVYDVAKVYLLAGRIDDALPLLKKAAQTCRALREPFRQTRYQYYLGQALEAKGDKAGACAAYQVVLDRWGGAVPSSVTADKARAHSIGLGCTT